MSTGELNSSDHRTGEFDGAAHSPGYLRAEADMQRSREREDTREHAQEIALANHILDCADYCGQMEHLQLWTLRKTLSPNLVKFSTVSRESLRAFFFP